MDDDARLVLNELRIVVFGEFFDDYEGTEKICKFLGLDQLTSRKDDKVSQEVGTDRIDAKAGLLSGIGFTQVLITIFLALLIVLVTVSIILRRRFAIIR